MSLISLLSSTILSGGGDFYNLETQVEDNIANSNNDEEDQLYAMLTKNKSADVKDQKPGNVCRLLSKAHSKE